MIVNGQKLIRATKKIKLFRFIYRRALKRHVNRKKRDLKIYHVLFEVWETKIDK